MNVRHICGQSTLQWLQQYETQVNKNFQCALIQLMKVICWPRSVEYMLFVFAFFFHSVYLFCWFDTYVFNCISFFPQDRILFWKIVDPYLYTIFTFLTKFYTKAIVKYRTPFHSYLCFVRFSTLCSLSRCNFRSYSIIILFWEKYYSKISVIALNAFIAILANRKYPNVFGEKHFRIQSVTRASKIT